MLEIKDLTVRYGYALILDKVNMKVDDEELVSVVGPNGAGKTTLLRTVSGLAKPEKTGAIIFNGSRINELDPWEIVKKGIIHCPEGRKVFPELTVLENLMIGAYLRKDKNKIEKDLEWVFSLFPVLKERKSQMAGTLSGGEQQMLAIGRALMSNPKILMIDEPSLGLAPVIKKRLFKTIKEIQSSGVTMLLVEQDVKAALEISDRIYVLAHGRIVANGTREEIVQMDDVRKAYLGI
jgi:branched-chain amino acid transport system ATP-binding protein